MHKHFHGLVMGISVLPALLVLPVVAGATEYTDTIKISEYEYPLNNIDWTITGAAGTAGSRNSLTGVNVDQSISFLGASTNIDVQFPNAADRATGVFVGHGTTPLEDEVHFSADNTNINFYSSAAKSRQWPLALEVQNATAVFDGDGDVVISGLADSFTSQVVTSRANSHISFENGGDLTINAKSPYGATGIVNEGTLSANIGGDLTINTGAVDENGDYDTAAVFSSNSVAIMTYANNIGLTAKNINLNSYGSGSNYTSNNDASDGTIVVEMEGGNVSIDADNLNILAHSTAALDSKHNKSRGIMFVKNSAVTSFTTSENTNANITVIHENAEAYGIDFDTDNNSTGTLDFGKDLSITATGATIAQGARVNSGSELNVVGDLMVNATATGNTGKAYGLNVIGGDVTVGGDINITTTGKNEDAYGIYVTSGNVVGNGDVNITASNRGIRAEGANSNVELTGKNISIAGGFNALRANNGATITLGDENTESIVLNSVGQLGAVARANSKITLNAKDVKISDTNGYYAILSQNSTDSETDTSKLARFDINAENIEITADDNAIGALSQGIVNINGNSVISGGEAAITARGGATVNINANNDKTTKMTGNIDFNYDKLTSGTVVDATVNVNLHGADSYWNGNTVASYENGEAPTPNYMQVNSVSLAMDGGAVWNATKIIDVKADAQSGFGYVALNNLDIDNGTVNIADTERGIFVENANIKDATFNGGDLHIVETLNVNGGKNVFNSNIVGDTGVLTIANNAILNIGDASITQDKIHLNGTMIARLNNTNDDYRLNAISEFDGTGTLALALSNAGEYKVFGGKIFESGTVDMTDINFDSPIYNLSWTDEGKSLLAVKKTVEEIVEKTHVSEQAAATVSNLSESTSEKLNDLSLLVQEKLAENTEEAKAAVEHATKAIHPEVESVMQSVTSSVQSTVTNLASARMAMPSVGRSAGDVEFTSGGVWAQGIFNKSKQNDAFNGYTRGVAAGLDGTINKQWTIGAGYSFAHSDIDSEARNTEIDTSTLFVYGQYKPSEWYANAVLNYTMSDYSENGTAMGMPVQAEYNVNSFGANVATGYDFADGITPELG